MLDNESAPDHVLAITISGQMTISDIEQYRTELEAKLKNHERVGLCVDFSELADISAETLYKGLKADLEFFGRFQRIARYALISEQRWPQAIIDFTRPLFPNVEMKLFAPGDSEHARQWAASLPLLTDPRTAAVRFLTVDRDDVLAFEINGVVSLAEIPEVISEFELFLAKHERVRVLSRMTHFGGIEPRIFAQSNLASIKLAVMRKVTRYAIVGAPAWMDEVIENLNPVFAEINVKAFPADHETDAWAWISS